MSAADFQADLFLPSPHAASVKHEHTRRMNHRERVLETLSDGAWHTNSELFAVGGFRYGARVDEIRRGVGHQVGHIVHCVDRGAGRFAFRLDPYPGVGLVAGCRCPDCKGVKP